MAMNITPDEESKMLNPDIAVISIGTRKLRTIHIYPLSVHDQFKFSDVVTEALEKFLTLRDGTASLMETAGKIDDLADLEDRAEEVNQNVKFVADMIGLIRENLDELLSLVTDGRERGKNILADISNNQAVEIAEVIYRQNYEMLQKKVLNLLKGKTAQMMSQGN